MLHHKAATTYDSASQRDHAPQFLGLIVAASSLLVLGLRLPIDRPPRNQESDAKDGRERINWADPLGRFTLDLDQNWQLPFVGSPKRIFRRRLLPDKGPLRQLLSRRPLEVQLTVVESTRSPAATIRELDKRINLENERVAVKNPPQLGEGSLFIRIRSPGAPKEFRLPPEEHLAQITDHVLVPGPGFVLRMRFWYLEPLEEKARVARDQFLEGLTIADTPPASPRVPRQGHRFPGLSLKAESSAPRGDQPETARDLTGLVRLRTIPDGWRLERLSDGHPLEGLALRFDDLDLRVRLLPFPLPRGSWASHFTPEKEVTTAFPPLRHLAKFDLPDVPIVKNPGGAYLVKGGADDEALLWLELGNEDVTVIAVCFWKWEDGSPAVEALSTLFQQMDLPARGEPVPGPAIGQWRDMFRELTRMPGRRSKKPYSFLWTFESDGTFRRDDYAGNPPRVVGTERGQCRFMDGRYLVLYFENCDLQVLPAEPAVHRNSSRMMLNFRKLFKHKSGDSLSPW